MSSQRNKKRVARPRAGAELVLSMRRGRTIKNKKVLQSKYACRKKEPDV